MEEFYSYKEKTLQKRQSRETKYNTTKKIKNIDITMYNYKLYTIASWQVDKLITKSTSMTSWFNFVKLHHHLTSNFTCFLYH